MKCMQTRNDVFMTIDSWVFLGMGSNKNDGTTSGMKYKLQNYAAFDEWSMVSAGAYNLSQLSSTRTRVIHGQDHSYTASFSCDYQLLRVYLDYFPSTREEMLDLALTGADTSTFRNQFRSFVHDSIRFTFIAITFYVFQFESDVLQNNNQTAPVTKYTSPTTQEATNSTKGDFLNAVKSY